MKELRAHAGGETQASPEQCFALLADIAGYPTWYPQGVRRAEVVEQDEQGRPAKARVTLHAEQGPLVRDFDLLLNVNAERPDHVELTRVPHEPPDRERFEVSWRVLPRGATTRVELEFYANLSVPRLLPVGGIADAIARGFVDAALDALAPATPRP